MPYYEGLRHYEHFNVSMWLYVAVYCKGSETWRLTENSKRWVQATEKDALRRSSRISRKELEM
jgi:uncharacterized protein (DUF302 family)